MLVSKNGVATKVQKMMAVVNGVATPVKKVYAVVNGVVKSVWEAVKKANVKYFGSSSGGQVSGLSASRYYITATKVGSSYAVFSDGVYYYNSRREAARSNIDAYNTSLTQTTISGGSGYRSIGSASVGNYGLFTGGYGISTKSCVSRTKSINTSLTRSNAGYITNAAESVCGGSIGNYAIFLGGKDENGNYVENGDVYNSSLTQSTTMSWPQRSMASANVGKYVLFSGGYSSNGAMSQVKPYDSSVTYQGIWYLGFSTYFHAGASTTNYAIFAGGGTNAGTAISNACAFNSSLTRTDLTSLTTPAHGLAATSVNGVAIFAGGGDSIGHSSDASLTLVHYYDDSLTQYIGEPLSVGRNNLAAATVGKYAIFGGGCSSGANSSAVDVYTF